MDSLSNTIANGLINEFKDYLPRVQALAEKLSEAQFWTKPYPYGNSFGHLTLHITGNLNYYIGAQIARTGYVRDREREFTEPAPPSKEVALQRLDEAVAMVIATLEQENADSWSRAYQATGVNDPINNHLSIYLRCTSHFYHHIGQMIYLVKEFTK